MYLTLKELEGIWDNFNPNEPQNENENEKPDTNPYLNMTEGRLVKKLTDCSKEMDRLMVEYGEVYDFDPYVPGYDTQKRTTEDVDLDICYTLWDTHKVVRELCYRYNVNVD